MLFSINMVKSMTIQSTNYDTKFDAVPQFWQYLAGLEYADLITELIQNDLDANASYTLIEFQQDRLTCQGDGDSVDKEGWLRLAYLMGAGDLVPRKHYCIGIKNHGLKACFTIGDDIYIRSAGQYMHQTLYRKGTNSPPYPGAFLEPQLDVGAPSKGCFVEVEYRRKLLSVDVGEPLEKLPLRDEEVDRMFVTACQQAPQRYIGALRSGFRDIYVLVFRHYRLGTARFEYRCRRARPFHGSMVYNRICRVSGDFSELPPDLHESCYLFSVPLPRGSKIEIPDFFKARRGFYSEIAWETRSNGSPKNTLGHRRYPIAYSGKDTNALSGVGVHYSGPYVSASERHEASGTSDINNYIDNACQSAIVSVLRRKLIPRYGARAMDILIADPSNPDEVILRGLVERMLDVGALPIMSSVHVPLKSTKRTASGKPKGQIKFGPRLTAKGTIRRLVVPTYSWTENGISPALSLLCPTEEDQIDRSVPVPVLRLLSDGKCNGWLENHIIFDEKVVIARFQPDIDTEHFPWQDKNLWRSSFSNPNIVCQYLDVIMATLGNDDKFSKDSLEPLKNNVYLPDTKLEITPMLQLFSGKNLPPGLLVKNLPPILHPQVAGHRIFRNYSNWKPPTFTFTEFLEKADIRNADENTRWLFWQWIAANWKNLKRLPWNRIADLPIWPDEHASLVPLASLCKPRDAKISKILADVIRFPHSKVLKVDPVANARRGSLRIRSLPTATELLSFIEKRLSTFSLDRILSDDEQRWFHLFEKDFAKISSNPEIRKAIPDFSSRAVALNYRGCLRPVHQLVRITEETKNLYLNKDDLINRSPSILDRLADWRPRIFPSSNQVLAALRQDPQRKNVLLARLQGYLKAAKLENKEDIVDDIKDIKCIPHDGHLRAPNELALKNIRGDYWGNWKHLLSGKGLSADVQKVYVSIGVIRSQPTPDTSLAFFQWLNTQNSGTVAANLNCIIRQIDHTGGPKAWSKEHPDIPFIPVEVSDVDIGLLSINQAVRPHGNVVVPDFAELVAAIRSTRGNRGAILAIISRRKVRCPISSYLRSIGIKSLREFAGMPEKVEGIQARPVPKSVSGELVRLRSKRVAQELRKRLDGLDLDLLSYPLRTQWRDRLVQIQGVQLAHSIMATFKVGRRRYILPMTAAYDEQTGIIWITDSEKKLRKALFRVVADLIFVNQTKLLPIVLEEALRRDFWEEDLNLGEGFSVGDDEGDSEEDDDAGDGDSDPGAANQTHRGVKPDPRKNLPRPGPIPTGRGNKPKPRKGLHGGSSASSNNIGGKGGRQPSSEEDKQIEDLKQKQYAYHCQICLAERSLKQLAPTHSYVELQENRSLLMMAHHSDQVHAGGARHAGNILILCSYHHDYIGNAISRDDITDALRRGTINKKIIFSSYVQGSVQNRTVNGQVATINMLLSGETIQVYFSDYHAEYWLQRASP